MHIITDKERYIGGPKAAKAIQWKTGGRGKMEQRRRTFSNRKFKQMDIKSCLKAVREPQQQAEQNNTL